MPRTLRHLNRTPWTDAERAIILRTGITEHQAAAELWAVLRVRRSASAVGVERRRVRSQNAQDEPRPGVALDPPVGRLVNEDKEATMDEILVCPECGSDQVTVTAEQSFMVNTGEHYCHSVKTYDDEAKARCLACQWTGHRGALVEDSKTPNVGIQRAGTAPME